MVPDIGSGFMVMGWNTPNRFQTAIECLLVRQRPGGPEERAYLSHECRAEAVSADEVFGRMNYEFVCISAWNGDFYLRSGAFNYGFNPLRNLRRERPRSTYEPAGSHIEVRCDDRAADFLSLDDALARLRAGDASGRRRLYMKVSFARGGFDYALYTACKYTNFPHPDRKDARYIQPISGYVLFEEADRFHIAYVVTHLLENGTGTTEFRVRDMTSFLSVKDSSSRMFLPFRLLDRAFLSAFLVTDEFVRVERVPDADCSLFVYA